MKRIILIAITILLYGGLCFSQKQKIDKVTISREPFSYRVLNNLNELHLKLKMMTLSDYLSLSESDSSFTTADSIGITLISGVTWELLGEHPKLPRFFLFRKDNQKVKDGMNFSIFKSECETRDKLPYELIEKFDVFIDIINDKNIKYLTLVYEISPNSNGEMIITNKTLSTIMK